MNGSHTMITQRNRAWRTRLAACAAVAAIATIGAACAGEAGAGSRWEATIDTVGDTVIVRTLSGGEWGPGARLVPDVRIGEFEGDDEYLLGEVAGLAVDRDGNIYMYDRQVPALRKYSPDGTFIRTFGRSGGGPGEYSNSDGGLAVLPDDRLVLRDPGNARFQLWTLDGEPAGHWQHIGGFFTSTPLFIDQAGNMYSSIIDFESGPPWKTSLVRYSPDGLPTDTIPAPDWDWESPTIRAERGDADNRSISINTVPFSPTESWTFSPAGYFVGGVSNEYSIDLFRPDGVLRIGRSYEPIRVQAAEKSNAEAVATENMRRMVSDWRWNGPPIPDTKPPFSNIIVAQDGRIWVVVSMPGEPIPEDERDDPVGADGQRRAVREWRQPTAFDVFEPDGRYVGVVRAPDGFRGNPQPVIRGDTIWAVVTDGLGVQQIVRMTVVVDPG